MTHLMLLSMLVFRALKDMVLGYIISDCNMLNLLLEYKFYSGTV